jgi:hypothetical protein
LLIFPFLNVFFSILCASHILLASFVSLFFLLVCARPITNDNTTTVTTHEVWTVVGIQACGGLLISLVVRYGDALLKGFATGLAIILTTAISVAFFGFKVTPTYLLGASTTFTAVLLYSGILPRLLAKLSRALAGAGGAAVGGGGGSGGGSGGGVLGFTGSDGGGGSGCGSAALLHQDDSTQAIQAPTTTTTTNSSAPLSPPSTATGYPWSKVAVGGALNAACLVLPNSLRRCAISTPATPPAP